MKLDLLQIKYMENILNNIVECYADTFFRSVEIFIVVEQNSQIYNYLIFEYLLIFNIIEII